MVAVTPKMAYPKKRMTMSDMVLGSSGSQPCQVSTLSCLEAGREFLDDLQLAVPAFVLTAPKTPVVRRSCRLLGDEEVDVADVPVTMPTC